MNSTLRMMLTLTALILIAGLQGCSWTRHESSARQKLDNLLGQAPESVPLAPIPQAEEAQRLPDWFGKPSLFGLPMPKAGVNVQETAEAYILRVPVATPGDADQVQVNVTPDRVEVSGQTGSQQGNLRSSSSFIQSFTTSQPVVPQKMSRKIEKVGEQNELVITIPKSGASKAGPQAASPALPDMPATKQRQLQEELEQASPFDDQPHQVI